MTRTPAQLAALTQRLGTDLALQWAGTAGAYVDADVATLDRPGPVGPALDIGIAAGVDQARQMLVNRLMTREGELTPLGHPEYGSRHHELIGEPNTARTRNLVKLYVLQALRREPRITKVERCVVHEEPRARDVVRIEISVRLIDRDDPLDLVVDLDLGGGR